MVFELNIINWQAIASILTLSLAVIAIVPIYRNRRSLKVTLTIARLREGTKEPEKVIFIFMTNNSYHPITLLRMSYSNTTDKKRFFFFGKKPQYLLASSGLPKIIYEGNFHREYVHNLGSNLEFLRCVYVTDSTGRTWKSSRKNVKQIKKFAEDPNNWCIVQFEKLIKEAK